MQDKLKEKFWEAKYEPEPDFASGIWRSIKLEEKKRACRKLWFLSGFGLISLTAAIPAISLVLKDLASSGFYEYLSLAFSNGGTFLQYWREFSMSLLESLPVTSIALSLFLIFTFFLLARQASKQIESAALSF